MGKRAYDQWRDNSSSSDAKRRRCRHYGEGFSDSFPDALRDFVQLTMSMEEKFERKIEKIETKRKEDKKKYKEDIRVLKKDRIVLEENYSVLKKDHSVLKEEYSVLKKDHSVLKEDHTAVKELLGILQEDIRVLKKDHIVLKKDHSVLKKDQEDLKFKIEEMQKESCAEVNHCEASPSQRSQPSQPTRFRLVIQNEVSSTIYKKDPIQTKDGRGHIKVVMYDGGIPIASDHPLASVRVEVVVIEGCFNESKQDSWPIEQFKESIVQPRKGATRLVKNGTFDLINGRCDHEGAIILDNSQQREFKLGVMVAVPTEVRVLEGVSNPFKVQEGKTKNSRSKGKGQEPSSPIPMRNLVQPSSTHATQHGQDLVIPGEQHSLAPPAIQDLLQEAEDNRLMIAAPVEGNGQALNVTGPNSSQQTQTLWQPTSTHSTQHGIWRSQGGPWTTLTTPYPARYATLPSTTIQNPSQAAGHCPVNQLQHAYEQDQQTSFANASSEHAFNNFSELFDDSTTNQSIQWNSFLQREMHVEDIYHSNVQTQFQDWTFCGQVLLRWDKPDVGLKERWNFLDKLMPLYSTHSGFCSQSFPSTSLMDKAHKLLASTSSGDSVLKMITRVTSRATQTPQRRGVLIRPVEPYDSDDKPPVKQQRHAKYQLRFVNSVCDNYYTREQIKSDDGNLLKVALYDENNLVVTSGPLSSASVELVLLHGDFDAEGQDNWTSEEFSSCLVYPQSIKEQPSLGGDRVLVLINGEADLGNVNFQTSSFHARTGKFKMGVEIKNVREERVQEGITSPFLVRVRQGEGGFSTKSKVGGGGYGVIYQEAKNTVENKLQDISAATRLFAYEEIKRITDNFAKDHVVGSGTFGVVYKGVLNDGKEIAIKKLYQNVTCDNEEKFQKEIKNLMEVKHKNIVRFLGYCHSRDMVTNRLLCFEYLPSGNLEKHVTDEFGGLDWHVRYNIIEGICSGLKYLHEERSIYHLDLKPANILLDKDMVPKIGDIGLSRLLGSMPIRITTPRYVPPEYIKENVISNKFDIFSLGTVIIRIIAGPMGYSKCADMSKQEFIRKVQENWRKRLQTTMDTTMDTTMWSRVSQVQTCIEIGLSCLEADRVKRPTITEIVDELNKIGTANSSAHGITSPFLVRVRQGEESSRHKITSLEALLRVKPEFPKQICGAMEHDDRENVGTSLALHDQPSQMRSLSVVRSASDGPPEPSTLLSLERKVIVEEEKLERKVEEEEEDDSASTHHVGGCLLNTIYNC